MKSLGNRRYRVDARSIGCRLDLRREISRFVAYLAETGARPEESTIDRYLADYDRDTHRTHPAIDH